MSDNDYEIVDASTIEFAGRSRKPKYALKLWEKDDAASVAKYYAAAHRIHCRRNNTDESPYSHYIDEREEYVNWWLQNTIHLISIEQIRLEEQDRISVYIECVCSVCGEEYNGFDSASSFFCTPCLEKENKEYEEMDNE